jgi:DNA-binding MarR family transcriptional regulator
MWADDARTVSGDWNLMAVRKLDDEDLDDVAGKVDISLGALERSGGFLLRIAQLSAFERFFTLFGQSEIRISEFTVLLALAENPGIRQGVLADVLKIKWSNMTKLVRALEGRGLISRHIPPDNRRSVELSVTEAGRKQIDAASAKMYRLDRDALSMLSDAEHEQLLVLTRKIAGWPEQN